MRKLKLFFACLLMAVLSIGQMWGGSVTFVAGTDNTTTAKEGITISMSNTAGGSGYYQAYKNSSMVVSSTSANITGVSFVCKASGDAQYGPGSFGTLEGYSYSGKTGTWSGSATSSVTFVASNNQVRMEEITVTYSGGGDPDPDPDPQTGDSYELVTDASKLAIGNEIIIVNLDGDKALSTTQNTNNRGAVDVTVSNNAIVPGVNVQVLTLGKTNNHWTLYTGNGYLYAAASDKNNMKTQTTNDANGEWTISIAEDGTVTAIAQGTNTRNELRYNPNSGNPIFSCYGSTSSMGKVKIYKKAGDAPTVAKPTISGKEQFISSTTVTLNHDDADAIYYTTNGDVPTTSLTPYSEPFVLTASATVKAIAVKGTETSDVAEKEFTKVSALTNMADVQAEAGNSEKSINVVISNWVVTGVSGSQVWIADAANEKGILLYKSGHGFEANKKLNGEVVGTKIKLYNLYPELTSLVSTDVTISNADDITPRGTTIAALTSAHPAEQGTVVKLENVTYTSSALSDGVNSIAADNKLYSSLALVDGTEYDITGVVTYYKDGNNAVVKIAPRSADDVYAHSAVVIPTAANLAALKDAARGTYILTLSNAVVSYVNGSNAFIEDATGGALIYFASHGYSAGDCLNGEYQVVTTDYQGKFEITAVEPQAGAATTTAEIPLTTLTITQLNANFGSYESRRVKIVGANVTDAIGGSDRNGAINDGAALAVYAAAGASKITLTHNDNVDVIGYPGFHNTDQQFNVWKQEDITVNEKDPAGIAFDPESATHTPGIDDWSAPTFSNPNNLDVDFGTNNDAVATVSNTGVVTLAGGYGTAIITAHTDGDATHSAGNAAYTITVNDPSLAPQNVVILAVYDTKYYAMSTTNANNGFTAIAVEYDGTQVTVKNAGEKAAIQWAKQTSGDNTTFQNAAGKYMKSADGASMSLQDAVCNWVWDATGEYYKIDGTSRTFFFQNGVGFKNYATSNIKKSGYSDKAQVIAIAAENIVITSKVSAELAYDPASDEITKGDDWSAPTLDNPHNVTITSYASDNEAVATVEGGVIALAGGIGTAHITAHFDGDGSYLEGDAVYTITVNAPAPVVTGTTYRKVTSTENLTNGDYLIVYETTSVAFNGALETLDDEGNSISVTINEGVIAGTTAIDAAVFTIDKTAGTLKSASGKYIGVSSNSNGLKQTENAETYTHTFSIDGEGNAVIAPAFEGSTMSLRYNTANNQLRFRYYKDNGQQAIQLYKRDAYTRTVTEGRYGTICLPRAGKMVGASIYEIAYFGQASNKVFFDEIVNGEMVAGMPYVFLPNENVTELKVVYTSTTEAEEAQSNNGLHGTLSAMTNILASDNIYLVYQNQILHSTVDGSTLAANRAYIKLGEIDPQEPALAPGRRRVSMGVQGEQVATAIDDLNATEVPVKVLINGQLFIIRGEKMFDATGRLVK